MYNIFFFVFSGPVFLVDIPNYYEQVSDGSKLHGIGYLSSYFLGVVMNHDFRHESRRIMTKHDP